MNTLRQALGLKGRFGIAMESEEETNATPDDAAVVMKGPLAEVYTQALDVAFNKDAPPPGGDPSAAPEPSAETGDNVEPGTIVPDPGTIIEPAEETNIPEVTAAVLESMQQDSVILQTLHDSLTPEEPESDEYMTLYAIDETKIEPANVIEVTQLLADTDKPEDVTVLIDSVAPAAFTDNMSEEDKAAAQCMSVGLESLVIGMGGKVVRSFKDYVASRRPV